MFFSIKFNQPPVLKINQITLDKNMIKVSGNVVKITRSETTFIQLKDETGSVDVVVFKGAIKNIDQIKIGEKVEVLGKPQKYKEKIEIVAVSIK